VHLGGLPDHTCKVTSKYDSYWAQRLEEIRAACERAVAGFPVTVGLPGLGSAGERQSWHGVAEVCGHDLAYSSMAHATSLGNAIAASGMCAAWPETVFRFAVASEGDALTITVAKGSPVRHGVPAALQQERAGAQGTPGTPKAALSEGASGIFAARTSLGRASGGPDAKRFYRALSQLADIRSGPRYLRDCHGVDGWPRQGVYFFFEQGEVRGDGSDRVVRVGTHALTATSQATLWGRLRQHRGPLAGRHAGGGNHRASVFRRHIGAAVIRRDKLPADLLASWLDRHGPWPGWAAREEEIEHSVSDHIRAMPFLWLGVPDRADRGSVERNSIALTSRLANGQDPPSSRWLGGCAARPEISQSGLWNVDHVRHHCEPGFLDLLERLLLQQGRLV
jgi:hypothetical protein